MAAAYQLYEQGQDALFHCDLENARRHFTEAAESYRRLSQSQKAYLANINILNAAICYHLANEPQHVIDMLDNINTRRLSAALKKLMADLREETRNRLRSSYWKTKLEDLRIMRIVKNHKSILEVLNDNPYILSSRDLAIQMRDSCLAQGMKGVAALFDADLENLSHDPAVPPSWM